MKVHSLANSLINLFTAVVEGILGLRLLLKLFGANENSGFVNWVYEMSSGLLSPFRGIFPTQVFENRYVLEFSTLFAMLMYTILALLLAALVNAVSKASHVVTDNDTAVDDDDDVVVTKRRRVAHTR